MYVSFAEYSLFCRSLLQNIVSFDNEKRECLERVNKVGDYGVATISRLVKIVGLFCKRALLFCKRAL